MRRCASTARSQPRTDSSGEAKNRSAVASNSSGGRKPVAERSFSPVPGRTSTSRPRCSARIPAVVIAFVSSLLTMRPTSGTHGWASIACTRARPTALRSQRPTATVGLTSTSACVT